MASFLDAFLHPGDQGGRRGADAGGRGSRRSGRSGSRARGCRRCRLRDPGGSGRRCRFSWRRAAGRVRWPRRSGARRSRRPPAGRAPEGVRARRVEQQAGLRVTQGRGFALMGVDGRALDAADGVVGGATLHSQRWSNNDASAESLRRMLAPARPCCSRWVRQAMTWGRVTRRIAPVRISREK